MPQDVFISYSSADREVADAVCRALEESGLTCWIAPRDVPAGKEWGDALLDAIKGSRAFVLIFSENANRSPQMRREVNYAIEKEVPVIPVRIEDTQPSDTMEYYLDITHWFDALPPPPQTHFPRLTDAVRQLLKEPADARQKPDDDGGGRRVVRPVVPLVSSGGRSRRLWWGVAGLLAVVCLAGGWLLWPGATPPAPPFADRGLPFSARTNYDQPEGLPVRRTPDGDPFAVLAGGSYVTVTGVCVNRDEVWWCPVRIEEGWVAEIQDRGAPQDALIAPQEDDVLSPGRRAQVVYGRPDGLSLRQNYGTSSKKLASLLRGTQLLVTGMPKDATGYRWWPVRLDSGHAEARWLEPAPLP
jgi:hypothetical protein